MIRLLNWTDYIDMKFNQHYNMIIIKAKCYNYEICCNRR